MIEFDGYRPGCLADVVGLHARYYALHWRFGLPFETKVATELAAFLRRLGPERDLFLAAYDDGAAIASIVIDAAEADQHGVHLRWFIAAVRGDGIGKQLMARAMGFCDSRGHQRVWLTTFAGLDAARSLYQRHGFDLAGESETDQWQGGVREQRFERRSKPQCMVS